MQVNNTINEQEIFRGDLNLWMTHLPQNLRQLPIIHLAIPGSHNTMTYTIHRYNNVGPDEPKCLQFLGKYFSIITRPIVFNWSVTEYDDVVDQLNGGIRYLDLRLAVKLDDNQVYFLHGLYGDEITPHLMDIVAWLDQHPREILILDHQHFYDFTENHHRSLVRKLKSIFGSKICPCNADLSKLTLQWMNERSFQVIVVYRNDISRVDSDLWPGELWPTPWPNTVRPDELVDFLDTRLKTRMPYTGYVSQCLLTPSVKYVLRHVCGSLHRDLTKICRQTSFAWIQRHSPGLGGLNIIITDFVSFDNYLFSRVVIQRNSRLLRDNDITDLQQYSNARKIGNYSSVL